MIYITIFTFLVILPSFLGGEKVFILSTVGKNATSDDQSAISTSLAALASVFGPGWVETASSSPFEKMKHSMR